MTPSIPIATDNIYKFVCLFSVAIFISCTLGNFYFRARYNEIGSRNILDLAELEERENLSPAQTKHKALIEYQININRVDREVSKWALAVIAGGSLIAFLFSVTKWYKDVQPKQDELLNLQIEKTKREIALLAKQLEKND